MSIERGGRTKRVAPKAAKAAAETKPIEQPKAKSTAWKPAAKPSSANDSKKLSASAESQLFPGTAGSTLEKQSCLNGLNPLETERPNAARNDPARLFEGPLVLSANGKTVSALNAEVRAAAAEGRVLSAKLANLPPASSPQRTELEGKLAAVDERLKKFGFNSTNAPRPGTLWVAPLFATPRVSVAADQPPAVPVTQAPPPLEALFAGGRTYSVVDDQGQKQTFQNPKEYQASVAAQRASLGMPRTDGEPVGVHMVFEGGGGKWKRYGPALNEAGRLGVIPTSVGGASAGSMVAALIAAGATPVQVDEVIRSELKQDEGKIPLGGLSDGKELFNGFEAKLRELTGITDRPVTFADLKIPLEILTTKMSDNQLPVGHEDLRQLDNRRFVFSQATTPNTSVSLAVRASAGLPGVFSAVQMFDPISDREIQLVDGGVLDNLPMKSVYNKGRPTIGLSLQELGGNHPEQGKQQPKNLDDFNVSVFERGFKNVSQSLGLLKAAAPDADDWRDRAEPAENAFMLSLPIWDLTNPAHTDSTLTFHYDKAIDPKIDAQTRDVTRKFFQKFLGELTVAGKRGSNITAQLPEKPAFTQDVDLRGNAFVATWNGEHGVTFTRKSDPSDHFEVVVGKTELERMYLDHLAFGDLSARLAKVGIDALSESPAL
jgi:NTE family protein